MENIRVEILESGIRVLTFDRAGSSANIFDIATLHELREKIEALPPEAAGVVFLSAKPGIFIAGADLHSLESLRGEDLRAYIELGQSVFNGIAALRVPTVAAIHGACVGGGYEMCLACAHRIATADRATKIGLPETQLGILPAWGGSTRLPRLIGIPGALDIILGGKTVAAKSALRRGMIDEIAPRERLLEAATKWIRTQGKARRRAAPRGWHRLVGAAVGPAARRKIAQKTRGNYPALPKALEVVTRGAALGAGESQRLEREAVLELAVTPECRNLLRVFHLQERARKLRLPGAEDGNRISRVAVIGAGVMGSGIAQWLSARGLRVLLRDIDAEKVAAGMGRISQLYAAAVKRHIFTAKEARDGMDRISPAAAEPPLNGVDLVIEAAVEKMELKKQIFARLDAQAGGRTLLATNTSALSITELATATQRPERVIGLHFFNPVQRMPLVEVITGKQTSAAATAAAVRFAQQIGKMPVVVRDSPGFLVNRILLPYLVEAGDLFAQGADAREIDEAMLDFGMPMGPLRLIDEVGLDVAEDVAAELAAAFPGRMHLPALLSRMRKAGALGRKAGHGFYVHKKGEATPDPQAAPFRDGESARGLPREALQRRMVLLMLNEAARCLEEKIVAEPADVDFGMIMGAGFAPFRGGPLRHADALGTSAVAAALREEARSAGARFEPCRLLEEMSATNRKFYDDD